MKKAGLYLGILLVLLFTAAYFYQEGQKQAPQVADSQASAPLAASQSDEAMSNRLNSETESSESSQVGQVNEASPMYDVKFYQASGDFRELRDFVGQPMVINIWASWCEPCREEMPLFEEAYQTYGDQVQFLMTSATGSNGVETLESAQAYLADYDFSFPVYYDLDQDSQVMFGAAMIPLTVFIDERGIVQQIHRGQLNAQDLEAGIQSLVSD